MRRSAWRIRQGISEVVETYSTQFARRKRLRADLFSRLDAWERVQLARHPMRPHGQQIAEVLFGELDPIRGDRGNADDPAIVTGVGLWRNRAVAVIACDRGQSKKEARKRNFGMPGPQGFRKAARLLEFSEKRQIPVVTFIDTPGAYPGAESERYCIAEAISRLLWTQAKVKTHTIGIVIGEGGSGGALALVMCDRMLMMEHAYFSVISPEACASILWRDGAKTALAAEKLKLLPEDLEKFQIIDEIIQEPLGGAHRYPIESACILREAVDRHLDSLLTLPIDSVLQQRFDRYRNIGAFVDGNDAR